MELMFTQSHSSAEERTATLMQEEPIDWIRDSVVDMASYERCRLRARDLCKIRIQQNHSEKILQNLQFTKTCTGVHVGHPSAERRGEYLNGAVGSVHLPSCQKWTLKVSSHNRLSTVNYV